LRLVTFDQDTRQRWGAVLADEIAPLDHAWPSLRLALGAGNAAIVAALAGTTARIPRAAVKLLPPIPDPEKIFCAGVNYKTHTGETGRETMAHPSMFMRFPDSQVGADFSDRPSVSLHRLRLGGRTGGDHRHARAPRSARPRI
jgi:2-keto-4-pentenoate hydratase/2-oxohepta-3-ene-1,7-dioic acid hydratase in catechol pathway